MHEIHYKARPDYYKDTDIPLDKEDYINKLSHPEYKIMVAENENDEIAGYIIYKIKKIEEHPLLVDRVVVYIEDLCVAGRFKRKGIGKKLLESAIEYGKEINASSIELTVWAFNEEAIKFYESLSFKPQSIKMEMIL
ncbi:N-acetyltransferase [Thermoanaerobacter sp. YS13]|uniref:GNAT family N-acetyltransferase n=1 Tax=Thermoanaerobacter sp. YS13 TaxID=1511746 RepID=UPI000B254E01|nr:GNAT family N-acetyltransferase [Thermoanaerobacter sp. YS13]